MAVNTDFIQHYIDQYISEESITSLLQLSTEYRKKHQDIDTPQRHEGDRRYKEIFGKENPTCVRNELIKLRKEYVGKASEIARMQAKKNDVEIDEWKEPEPKKSIEQKSYETDKNFEEAQDKMDQQKGKGLAPTFNELVASETKKEEQKKQLFEELKKKSMTMSMSFSQPLNNQSDLKEVPSKEEKKAQLVEQMKKNGVSMTQSLNNQAELQESISKEEQKKQLVEEMKKKSMTMSMPFSQPLNNQSDLTEILSKEEKKARLIEQMKQNAQDITKNREPGV